MHPLPALATGLLCGAVLGAGALAVVKLFKPRKKAEQSYQTSFIYSGNLKQTSIIDAIQLLEIGKRDGILHIFHGRRKGYIAFKLGAVIDAFYRNAVGREAIFAMMDLPEGDFYFESKAVSQPRLMADTAMDLVMMLESRRFQQATAGQDASQENAGQQGSPGNFLGLQ